MLTNERDSFWVVLLIISLVAVIWAISSLTVAYTVALCLYNGSLGADCVSRTG